MRLSWIIHLDPKCNQKGLVRGPVGARAASGDGVSDWSDAGARGCGRLWKREEARKGLSPGASGRNQPCLHLDFYPLSLILDFGPPQHKENGLCSFKRLRVWSTVAAVIGNYDIGSLRRLQPRPQPGLWSSEGSTEAAGSSPRRPTDRAVEWGPQFPYTHRAAECVLLT